MSVQKKINGLIDYIRMKLDSFPILDYQPLPWIGLNRAKRDAGVLSRWSVIEAQLDKLDVKSNLDIGCNVGYFSISIARKGINSIGVEGNPKYYRMLQYTIQKLELENIGVITWQLNENSIDLLPEADSVLFLSIWHHFVKYQGFESATKVLEKLWSKSNKVMFFETGELEMPSDYNLPDMKPDPQKYISDYLADTCKNSKIEFLGKHKAFSPSNQIIDRNMFAVIRDS